MNNHPQRALAPELRRQALRQAIGNSLAYLAQSQLPDGEFQTEFCYNRREGADGQIVEDLVFDSSPFVTSLVLYSLQFVRDFAPNVPGMIERGCDFLVSEMEPGGLWRYWARKNEKRSIIPPDLDDTSCISHLLLSNGRRVPNNRWLFYDSRDSRGAFYTWLYTPNSLRKKLLSLLTHGRAFSCTDQIWQWTGKDDVCAVVNANAALYLGDVRQTRGAIEYLKATIRERREESEIVFYAHKLSLYYMLTRAYFHGVRAFGDLNDILEARILELRRPDGSFGDELATGLAVCSLLNLHPSPDGLEGAIDFLIGAQQPNGAWRRIPMYGGPPVPTTFGSADLTTSVCLEALARYGSAAGAPPR